MEYEFELAQDLKDAKKRNDTVVGIERLQEHSNSTSIFDTIIVPGMGDTLTPVVPSVFEEKVEPPAKKKRGKKAK